MDANRVVYQLMFQLNLVLLLVYNFTVAIVCHLHIQMNMALLMEMLKIKILKLCQSSNYAVSQCMSLFVCSLGNYVGRALRENHPSLFSNVLDGQF